MRAVTPSHTRSNDLVASFHEDDLHARDVDPPVGLEFVSNPLRWSFRSHHAFLLVSKGWWTRFELVSDRNDEIPAGAPSRGRRARTFR